MKILLDDLLPRLFPGLEVQVHFQCVPHEGKADLDKSIPKKLKAWREPDVRFVVVRDNDSADCVALKRRIEGVCVEAGRPETLIRLVCQELESWYIGDLGALEAAFPRCRMDTPALRKKFSDPDSWQKPSNELSRLIPSFQKLSGARLMASNLRGENNRSRSFCVFLDGLRRIVAEMGYVYEGGG
ncbi:MULTISPECIES: DUF4276 family protein [Burkholderia]|nr:MULTISPECIES: DUF4276 family protein [Burkholderia]